VEWLGEHSLTLFLLVTGIAWVVAFKAMDPNRQWGQVVGNIVSEWTQILGLVLMTKRLRWRLGVRRADGGACRLSPLSDSSN
jgi:hypothetical protein